MTLEEIRKQVREGTMSRPALIKNLRRVRMLAIDRNDKEMLKLFEDPVEQIADRMLVESKKC